MYMRGHTFGYLSSSTLRVSLPAGLRSPWSRKPASLTTSPSEPRLSTSAQALIKAALPENVAAIAMDGMRLTGLERLSLQRV